MNEKKTHVQIKESDKEKLINIKKKLGYASIEIVVNKMITKCGDKNL